MKCRTLSYAVLGLLVLVGNLSSAADKATEKKAVEALKLLGGKVECPLCGYDLSGLREARCPECGSLPTNTVWIFNPPEGAAEGGGAGQRRPANEIMAAIRAERAGRTPCRPISDLFLTGAGIRS